MYIVKSRGVSKVTPDFFINKICEIKYDENIKLANDLLSPIKKKQKVDQK